MRQSVVYLCLDVDGPAAEAALVGLGVAMGHGAHGGDAKEEGRLLLVLGDDGVVGGVGTDGGDVG